jgi:CubicO group peptidase (beta-lactamase class C family)
MMSTRTRALAAASLFAWLLGACLEADGLGLDVDAGPVHAGDGGRDAGPPAPEDLDGYVQWEMEGHGIAGLAAVIVKDDAIAWTGRFGYADLEAMTPVTENTLFLVASISKTIVTVPIMQLAEERVIQLDAPVDAYLPYAVRHPGFPDVPITARMLLTHSSGLEDDFIKLAMAMDPGMAPTTLAEFSEQYVTPGGALDGEHNWGARPGTDWSYCNAAYGVLGHLAEVAGGASLPELTRTGVREPLGMTQSGWLGADVSADAMAVGYTWNGRAYTELEYEVMSYYPAGGFATSVAELSRFLRAFIRLGELDGARILEEETVHAMREPQVPSIASGQGITWSYERLAGATWLGHSGATLGGSAQMLFRPDDGTAIIVLTNSDAYVLARLGIRDTADALDRIVERIAVEAGAI